VLTKADWSTTASGEALGRPAIRSVFRQRLDAKNRHNVATMAIYLLAQWIRTSSSSRLRL